MQRIAVYPGSFDPVTNGHVDIVQRASKLFDRIVVAILHNPAKKTLFTIEERLEMLRESMQHIPGLSFDVFNGLLVQYVQDKGAHAILRGMRAVSDFEYEFQLALMNRKLNRDIETVFLMTGMRWFFTSSSIIKEAALFGGDITDMVPALVYRRLVAKFEALQKANPLRLTNQPDDNL
ncbi:MAG: pantetheine-phosphate adenylyltransferase [Desulfatitalea sp.]|nr:pantetheine-phosphate adenylyltransferase [Desulfatitalea sp.]